jgi:hypothetical protein
MHGLDCATPRGLQHPPMCSQSATAEWVGVATIFNANVRSRARAGIRLWPSEHLSVGAQVEVWMHRSAFGLR